MHGLVLAGQTKDNNDAVLLSLTCEDFEVCRRGLFIDLGYHILDSLLRDIPTGYNSALATDFAALNQRYVSKEVWKKCETVENAINLASEFYKEEITLKEVKTLRVLIGRATETNQGYQKVFTYVNPGSTIASAVIMLGAGLYDPKISITANNVSAFVARRIAETNPLCTYSHHIPASIFKLIKQESEIEAVEKGLIEAVNDITTSHIKNFMETAILSEQKIPVGKEEVKIGRFMNDNKIAFNGDFAYLKL